MDRQSRVLCDGPTDGKPCKGACSECAPTWSEGNLERSLDQHLQRLQLHADVLLLLGGLVRP